MINTVLKVSMIALLIILAGGLLPAAASEPSSYTVEFPIQLRNNVSVKMGAVVVTNPRHPRNGLQVLVLNGTGQTANTFKPLAQAIFADQFGGIVSRMVLLNYPGHGNSGYPVGVKFGDLTVDDYVTSLLASIEGLTPMGLRPNVLLGHSLGAEIIMLAQQRLLNQGTTLRSKYGILGAVFLVPDIPGPLPWAFVDSGMAAPLVGQLVRPDPVLGNVLDIPPPVWVSLFYSDRNGALAPGATTPDEAVNKGYISLDSATAGAELLGLNGARPLVNSGIFSNNRGTIASVITFEQDSLYVFPLEHQNLYSYLTFDQSGKLFFTVGGAQSVHNLHVINPGAILTAVKTALLSCR